MWSMKKFFTTPFLWCLLLPSMTVAFTPVGPMATTSTTSFKIGSNNPSLSVPLVPSSTSSSSSTTTTKTTTTTTTTTSLNAEVPDLDTIALVVGQENYGLAVVVVGEAIYSFVQAPTFDQALKTLGPAVVSALILVLVSGPMVTSGDMGSVGFGLWIATAVSLLMGGAYLLRCLAPTSPTPKEVPALGVLIAAAGFFSFTQNLIVDGFVTLPTLPSIELPSLPSIDLPF